MGEARILIGKKGSDRKIDEAKIGKGKKPHTADVEGQYRNHPYTTCPYCWSLNDVEIDPNVWVGYYCWNCGGYFEV